jgi:HEAT repeat protein
MRNQYLKFAIIVTMLLGLSSVARSEDNAVASLKSESKLIEIISGDSPSADKALACKRLAIYGTAAAADSLGKLLPDPQLSSWARIALEAIPGNECDVVLRQATESVTGLQLVGVINSIGIRKDSEAVETLKAQLQSMDAQVASAAAVALGSIGGESAANELKSLLAASSAAVRSAAAEGCVLCAEKFSAAGKKEMAIELFDNVRHADVPKQRVVEATRGAILARGIAGIPLLIEQLRSADRPLFNVGLWTARELEGIEVVSALVEEVKQAAPEKAALIVQSLADRKGTLDLPTLIQIASSGPQVVRIASMSAISRVGDVSCVEPLLQFAMEKDAHLLLPAKEALKELQDEAVDGEILKRLPSATGDLQQLLIEVIGQRRIEATAELVKVLGTDAANARKSALEALGNTLTQKDLSILIQQVLAPKFAEDLAFAKQSLQTAAIRMPDRDACATTIAEAMKDSPVEKKVMFLDVLGGMTGSKALELLGNAGKESDPELKDVATKILGDWLTVDAAPVLLDLATNGPADKYQVRAMRGYIRIARQFVMSDKDRVAMCTKALAVAKQSAERKLVTEIFSRYPSLGMLKLAIEMSKDAELKEDSVKAAQAIAAKLGGKKEVKDLLSKAGIPMQ